ncbi:MAG: cupredoxin domain-containing protein [Minisyncoccia bacterium]
MSSKILPISILISAVIVGGAVLFTQGRNPSPQSGVSAPVDNVSIADGKQIIEIAAKGGYRPGESIAKAGVPTVLRFRTNGTFDCSSSIRIPSLNISKVLPSSGNTDIDIGTPQLSTLLGTCGMGMYRFQVDFRS